VHVDGALDGVCILGGASCLLFSTLGPEGGKMEKRDKSEGVSVSEGAKAEGDVAA